MKKLVCLLSTICMTFCLSACSDLLSGDLLSPMTSIQSSQTGGSASVGAQESLEEGSSIEESSAPESSDSQQPATSEEPSTSEEIEKPEAYKYTDFTAEEKAVFMQYIGEVLPFPATNDYEFETYYDDYYYSDGITFSTSGNTQADFDAYRALFADYTFMETYLDDFNDTWYWYEKGDIVVDMSYYYYEGEWWINVYVCTQGDSAGGNGNLGGGGTDGDYETDENVITNAGAGLPTGKNGVYNVDFTKATNVKNVTDQGYYLDGCPTTGSPAVLVIPVEFSDATANSKGYSIDKIKKAFNGGTGTTDYYSVQDYYYTASYGQLDLEITVLDSWFKPKNSSSYYAKQTMDYYGSKLNIGDQMVLDEALAYLESRMDLSKFDTDKNSIIDSVVLITTLDVDSDTDFQWAFRFWNLYTDNDGYYYEYDGVSANDYLWASYQFMHETTNRNGDIVYTDTSAINTYTYIHEFGHVLGADDYYDTAYVNHPLGGHDVMDGMVGDHNPYTKFNYGWLTNSRLVVAESTITLTLTDFSKNGDTIIIANNWDESLGAYQEYYVLVYYKNTGLNGGEFGYFEEEGILVYHINASLYKEIQDGETYYDVYNTNTDASDTNYGKKDNLIEFVLSTDGEYVYRVGDTISAKTTDDQGNKIAYTFTVDSLTSTTATITFTKNK